jgi:hypothetical protein
MNDKQALAYARKRWGKTAAVCDEGPKYRHQNMRYRLGRVVMGAFFEVCSWGGNWQEAVDLAEAAFANDHVKVCALSNGVLVQCR